MGTPAKHGKKRKSTTTPTKSTQNSARKSRKLFEPLSIENFCPNLVASRLLSCGEGEQLGHPGRNTTKKPRAVDTFPKDTKFLQVAAGGVHSLVLTTDGTVYSCGVNEKGTVPVAGLEAEESTDRFSEIVFPEDVKKLGKIVQVTAGASFSAALTEKGSVVAWGNLRDTQGEVNVHEMLKDIQKKPSIVIRHRSKEHWHIVKIAAGENHLAMLSTEGELLTFGEGSMGQLGRSTRTEHIRSKFMVDQSGTSLILRVLEKHQFIRFVDVWARGFWTMGRAQDGRLFVCGLNNFGQLGVIATEKKAPSRRHRSASQRKSAATTTTKAAGKGGPATMEALNFDELDISALNQVSSEDSSQEPEPDEAEGGNSTNDEELLGQQPLKKKPPQPEEEKKLEAEGQNAKRNNASASRVGMGEHGQQNGKVATSMEPAPVATTSTAAEAARAKEEQKDDDAPMDNADAEDEDGNDDANAKPKIIGQEEANKVALLTWAQAFPPDAKWTHVSGVQHLVCCSEDGKLFGIGKNTDNALGLGTWEGNRDEKHWRYDTLQEVPLPEGVKVAGIDATLGASIFWTDNGKVFGFGCDTVGQLGLGIKDEDEEKIVPTPRQIGSAHLEGFRVVSVSIADNHSLFLAAPEHHPEPQAAVVDVDEKMNVEVEKQEEEEEEKPEEASKAAKVAPAPARPRRECRD